MHEDEDANRTPWDESCDNVPCYNSCVGYYKDSHAGRHLSAFDIVPSQPVAGAPSGTPVANIDSDATIVSRFLEQSSVV